MYKKIVLMVFASMCIILFLTQFNAYVMAPHDLIFVEGKLASDVSDLEDSITKMAYNTVILNQTFDDESVVDVPKNWTIAQAQYGGFTVDNQTYYSGGKSAKFVDNSTLGSPCPYMIFTEQKGTIVVTFAIRLAANRGNNTNLIIYIDDGNFSGSNINFTNRGTIEYHDNNGSYVLRNYLNKTWYRIKMIMNIPNNTYDIYINELLEARDAKFNKFGTCSETHRIIFGEALFWQPIGYIDDIMIRTSIRVPEDYPTIQEAIDAANPGNIICISSNSRPYYENVYFRNKHDLKLIGENKSTTIIDGRFGTDENVVSIDEESYNITISGFTVENGNVGIHMEGENNTITENIILNNEIGVNFLGVKNNVKHNRFISNTQQALDYSARAENLWDHNYWSDYEGRDDDKDGIGDTPYFIRLGNRTMNHDNYPLFLIKTVIRNPAKPSYDETVRISVTTLEDVEIDKPILNFTCGSVWKSINMTRAPGNWTGTIGSLPYGTKVRYKIHAGSCCGVWVVSATFSYNVTDTVSPEIKDVARIPKNATENEAVNIIANVSEPINASRILEVTLYWKTDEIGKWVKIPMKETKSTVTQDSETKTMEAAIPRLPRQSNVTCYVEAFDKAGNSEKSDEYSYTVEFACLKSPEILDFVIGEGEIKNFTFSIGNEGVSTLNWSISIPEGTPWIKSVEPKNGLLEGGKKITVKVKIDATDLALKYYYREKLEVTSNGGNESVPVLLTVTRIIIDRSLVSDDRCDIGSNQTVYFHAVWGHNFSAVQNGMINVTCIDDTTNATDWAIHMTNATGWVSFTNSSLMVRNRTWTVTGVDCNGITSYTQEAPNPSIIWDRANITLAIQNDRIKVGENATIMWSGKYEYDRTPFSGSLTLNDTRTRYTTPDARGYTTLSILDPVHGLEAFTSNSRTCTWEEPVLFWSEWAFLIMIAVVAAMGGGIFSTLAFWTLRTYKRKGCNQEKIRMH